MGSKSWRKGNLVLNRGMKRTWPFPVNWPHMGRTCTLIIPHADVLPCWFMSVSSLTQQDNSAYLKAIKYCYWSYLLFSWEISVCDIAERTRRSLKLATVFHWILPRLLWASGGSGCKMWHTAQIRVLESQTRWDFREHLVHFPPFIVEKVVVPRSEVPHWRSYTSC